MNLVGILALALTLDMEFWSIMLLMGEMVEQMCTLGVPSGTLCVHSQDRIIWSTIEYAPRIEEYAQHTWRVDLAKLARLS